MFIGFLLVILNIALIPVLLFVDGAVAQACITGLSAAALAMAGLNMQAGGPEHLRPTLPRLAVAALVPAIWMLIQILPLGLFGIGHPIWSSASTALGSSLSASLSVDPGNTLIALGRYAGFVALSLAVSILMVERRNAEWALFVLLSASAAVALLVLSRSDIILGNSQTTIQNGTRAAALTILAIGCVVAVAAILRAYERSETRKSGPGLLVLSDAAPGMAVGGIVFILCALALLRFGDDYIIMAAGLGLSTFAALALTRRLGFGVWGMAAIGIVLAAIAFAVFNLSGTFRSSNPLLAFVSSGKSVAAGFTERMLADVRWGGTGGGTFVELAELYRDVNEQVFSTTSSVSTAAVLAIDLGRPALFFIGIGVVVLAVILLRATIRRGRDSFFPAAGVASIVVLTTTAFGNTAVLTTAPAIVAATIIGLAIAQSTGRTAKR